MSHVFPAHSEAPTPSHVTEGKLTWSDALLLGYPAMDETHQDFVRCVGALQSSPDTEFPARLRDTLTHCESHFEQEAGWMKSTDFPAAQCHIDEHEAVLRSLREAEEFLGRGGDLQRVRSIAAALVDWFPAHADYMDAALSHWMSKRKHGGAPVVLRRQGTQPPR